MEETKKVVRKVRADNSSQDLVLKKHVGLIHCENKLTLIQRKICNILLFNALEKIKEEDIHELPLRQLCSLVGYNSNDINLIKKSLKSLISVVIEWNLLDDSKFINEAGLAEEVISWNASALLAGASIEKGLVRYSYSPQIKTVLSSLEIYGRINLFVQSKFDSSYSLVLYENCVRFKNIKQTRWFPLQLFRSLMGVVEEKYPSFKEFKRNVLTVAINEINLKSDIFIEPIYKTIRRQITAVQFLISENQSYKPVFKRARNLPKEDVATNKELTVLELLISEFELSEKQAKRILSDYDLEYIQEKMSLLKGKENIKNYGAYLLSALMNDYKASQNKPVSQAGLKKSTENSYLRESIDASENHSLTNKYREYKLNYYNKNILLESERTQKEIHENFVSAIGSNSFLLSNYRKSKFKSALVIIEFIQFLENNYKNIMQGCLIFDEFITAEEDVVIA